MGSEKTRKITLFLLRPSSPVPAQAWKFEDEPVIRIGRLADNHVVLYSAVVSRHHVELRRTTSGWDVVNIGANGTYIDGKRVEQTVASDGMVLCIADTGPHLQIRFGDVDSEVGVTSRPASSPSSPPKGDAKAGSTFLKKKKKQSQSE